MYRFALLAALILPIAACTTAAESDEVPSPRFAYLVVMEGETTINKGQFELFLRKGTREPLAAERVHAFKEPKENRYVFGDNRRVDRVCIGNDCGVFSPMPNRADGFVAVFPESFQRRRGG